MKNKLASLLVWALLSSCASENDGDASIVLGEWHHAGGSHFSDKYAPLDQINREISLYLVAVVGSQGLKLSNIRRSPT